MTTECEQATVPPIESFARAGLTWQAIRTLAGVFAFGLMLDWAGAAQADAGAVGYLSTTALPDAFQVLAPPPAAESAAGTADLAAFRSTRGLAGQPRWLLATRDADYSPAAVLAGYACALDVKLDAANAPHLVILLGRVAVDTSAAARRVKQVYRRSRPFVGTDLPICVAREEGISASYSYPSGHATYGWTSALLLAELAPERASAVARRGLAYGESRVICGVHFPSDVEAGRTLGAVIVANVHASAELRADMAAARLELDAARATGRYRPDPEQCAADAAIADVHW